MNSTTSLVAKQYRIQQWAELIKECQNRPEGMSVQTWCQQNGITKADYYYRMRCVRQACLDSMKPDIVQIPTPQSAPIAPDDLKQELTIMIGDVSIHVNQATSVSLLKNVIKAVRDAK